MQKRISLLMGTSLFAVFCSLFFAGISRAAVTDTIINLLNPVSILGVTVLGGGAATMHLINATTSQDVSLPSASGQSGKILIYKRTDHNYGLAVNVVAPGGENIDGSSNVYAPLGSSGYAMFVGDPTNNTWWLVGNQNY